MVRVKSIQNVVQDDVQTVVPGIDLVKGGELSSTLLST